MVRVFHSFKTVKKGWRYGNGEEQGAKEGDSRVIRNSSLYLKMQDDSRPISDSVVS